MVRLKATNTLCIANDMISCAIWNKQAQVNFSKTNKIAGARRASTIWGHKLRYPGCTLDLKANDLIGHL